MAKVTMRQMLEAGVHFGHQTRFWNPKMATYIFGERNKIHIINLEKTLPLFNDAVNAVSKIASHNGKVLFVGTKRAARQPIMEEAIRAGMPYVNHRWLGGMLTNYATVRKSLDLMFEIEEMETSGALAQRPVKERMRLLRRKEKLQANLGGIRDMGTLPDLLFVVDTRKDMLAVQEANRLKIPVVALVDTNCDPEEITHPIPANDDAIRAIALFCGFIANSVNEGREQYDKRQEEYAAEADKVASADSEAVAMEQKVEEK